MAKAAKSSSPHMKKMVSLAHTLKGMHHKADGGGIDSEQSNYDKGVQKLKDTSKLLGTKSYSAWQPSQARAISDTVRKGPNAGATSFFRDDD
jgi:hypothetical protein